MATNCLIEIKLITYYWLAPVRKNKTVLNHMRRKLLLKEGLYFSIIFNLISLVIWWHVTVSLNPITTVFLGPIKVSVSSNNFYQPWQSLSAPKSSLRQFKDHGCTREMDLGLNWLPLTVNEYGQVSDSLPAKEGGSVTSQQSPYEVSWDNNILDLTWHNDWNRHHLTNTSSSLSLLKWKGDISRTLFSAIKGRTESKQILHAREICSVLYVYATENQRSTEI